MERVVKFRGKTLSGKWVYGDLVHFTNTQGVDTSVIITEHQATAESDDFDYALCYARNEFKIVLPESVGQFTGLYDVNGEEIYEGDVIERYQDCPHYRNGVYYDGNAIYGVVQYIVGGFYIVAKENEVFKMCSNSDDMWIQGNIHDNPNLLSDGRD